MRTTLPTLTHSVTGRGPVWVFCITSRGSQIWRSIHPSAILHAIVMWEDDAFFSSAKARSKLCAPWRAYYNGDG